MCIQWHLIPECDHHKCGGQNRIEFDVRMTLSSNNNNQFFTTCLIIYTLQHIYSDYLNHRNHFRYELSQWETTLHCNVVSHWLSSSYPEWSFTIIVKHGHCGLVTPYGVIEPILVAWRNQAITWTNIAFSVVRLWDIHLRAIYSNHKLPFCIMILNTTRTKLQRHISETHELN